MPESMEFKEKFIERYSKLTDFEQFKKYSLTFLRRSIRVNTIKISTKDLVKRLENIWNLEPIPWCKDGFWIEHKEKERRDRCREGGYGTGRDLSPSDWSGKTGGRDDFPGTIFEVPGSCRHF